jgi:hypothetical protein
MANVNILSTIRPLTANVTKEVEPNGGDPLG